MTTTRFDARRFAGLGLGLVLVLASSACGPAEPRASAPEVVVAPPAAPHASVAAPVASPPATDGCLVVSEPFALKRHYADSRTHALKAREAREASSPPKDPCVADARSVDCRWFQAERHAEVRRYDEAATGFRGIAMEGDPSKGLWAAGRAIEGLFSLNLYTEPRRMACADRARDDVDVYLAMYCQPVPLEQRPRDLCEYLVRLRYDARRLQLENLIERADGLPETEAAPLYARAGDGYRAYYMERCPVGIPKPQRVDLRCVELIVNAYRAYRMAGRVVEGNEARAILLDPRHGMHDTEPAKKIGSAPPLPVP